MTRRIAVAGWFGAGNLGDELILSALAESLRARGAEPVAVSIDPVATRRDHEIESIAHRHPGHHLSLIRALRGCDAMAVAGGIIQAETSPWNVPFHTSRLAAAAAARRPAAAVGIGVGRVQGLAARSLARRALRRLRSVTVRDRDSAERLRSWGLPGAAVGADPVLGLRVEPVEPDDTMCVILRPPNRRGLRTAAAKAASTASATATASSTAALDRMARAIDAAAAATGLTPRLVAFQPGRDDPLHRAVADRMTAAAETLTPTRHSIVTEVGRSRLVVTMRYHGAIVALLHGRPAVLLDYSPKMASLASEASGWAPLVDPSCLDATTLAAAATAGLDNASRSREALAALRARLGANDAALDELASGGR